MPNRSFNRPHQSVAFAGRGALTGSTFDDTAFSE
jgi:hypothetical protein